MNLEKTISTEYQNLTSDTQRAIKVQKISPTLERELLKAYRKSLKHIEKEENIPLRYKLNMPFDTKDSFYSFVYDKLEKIEFTKIDLLLFYSAFLSIEQELAGYEKSIFLTAMMQTDFNRTKTTEEYFFLFSNIRLSYFGYKLNGPKIHIIGNVGRSLGCEMKSGTIHVFGNTHNFAGQRMKGGSIHITENTDDFLGDNMNGGNIIVDGVTRDYAGANMHKGDILVKTGARNDCCYKMEGGTFIVNGTVDYFADLLFGGTVIYNGKTYFKVSK